MSSQIKLQKWGNSHGIRLSKSILEQLGVTSLEDATFEVEIREGSLKLSVVTTELSYLDQLFLNYDGDDVAEPYDWGQPVGREMF